jgi:uncharacterized membrane protein YidH (DUF202 family)
MRSPRTTTAYRPRVAAVERTTLAWERSALAYGTFAAILLGAAAHRDEPWLLAPTGAVLAVAGILWRHAHRRGRAAGAARPPALLALVAALAAVVAAAAVLQGPS